jgi:hypothetical protein
MYSIKNIPNYPGYKVDTLGDVWTCWKTQITDRDTNGYVIRATQIQTDEWRKLKPYKSKWGYRMVRLCKDMTYKGKTISRLVAQTFIPNPENKPQVNHINGLKDNDNLENLEWNTQSENQQHAIRTGLKISLKGEHVFGSKLNEHQVRRIRLMKEVDPTITQERIASFFNVSRSCISFILSRRNWNHIS